MRLLSLSAFLGTISHACASVRAGSTLANRCSFGAGCYWGTEKFFKVDFGTKLYPRTIIDGKVGFMGGENANPSYREVCGGRTGHVEVYDLTFDGTEDTFEKLVKFFFSFHDPTTMNRQGNDAGTQYASAIFCYDNRQKEIAKNVINDLAKLVAQGKVPKYMESKISTAVRDASVFYPAMEEHQRYLEKQPWGYCNHGYRFKGWPV